MRLALFLVTASLSAQSLDDRYTKYLTALREPSLSELAQKDPGAEVYRFLYLRTFDNPIAIRLIVTPAGGRLISKKTSGMGGFEPGHLILSRESKLTKESTEWFLEDLKGVDFWNIPAIKNPEGNTVILDGAQWIIEGVKQGRYHFIDRTSPEGIDPAHNLGVALLINLARFRLLYQQVY
jgi:hypothetical protein